MGKGSKNELPKEVFAALPKDPDQQLEVAQQITQIAVSGRVAKLEADCSSLRQKVVEKDAVIGGLQARVIGAETTLAETTAKLAIALEGQARLIEDKNILSGQVEKLMCQVSKLDEFKKSLMKSLEASTECGDNVQNTPVQGDGCNPVSSSSASSSRPSSPSLMSKSTEPPTPTKRKQQGQFSCMTLEKPSPKSPASTSKSEGPDGASDDGASSKQSPLAPRTPPDNSPAKSARIDGKQFFRQARTRLTYEQFSEFLNNVKDLNAHRREKELKAAQFSFFHPKIYSCNTHVPPNCGDWVITSSKVAS
ncbi:hypothetical protein KC19_5G057800 [Ceratodon purpureus]|uniref:At4g15545-like C-terminal domain-containing protein n=1 Tax=Ceratodon purpureus TaxID=3225 RepID=A0A8T0HZQ7_CERPU|nr:hypothetical protein KC19_5G057800 [Ceratodon purpureus]